jgi:predicted RND superfamily exporter protein
MKAEQKKVQSIANHKISQELETLNKLVVLVIETDDILEKLEVNSISEFEESINKKSGFVNSLMSATAYGKDAEYKRLLHLEKLIDNRLRSEDLTASKELKSTLVASITEKHTTYYSTEDLKLKKTLEEITVKYNSLNLEQRQHIAFNRYNELAYKPFSNLKN